MEVPKMPVIYVAGAYRSATEWGLVQNIRDAEEAALFLWKLGFAVICPHKNTAHFGGAADDSVWLDGDLAILVRCDAIYMIHNWHSSKGATGERQFAEAHGIPVLEEGDNCGDWIEQWRQRQA